jgi:hypothetical protein
MEGGHYDLMKEYKAQGIQAKILLQGCDGRCLEMAPASKTMLFSTVYRHCLLIRKRAEV